MSRYGSPRIDRAPHREGTAVYNNQTLALLDEARDLAMTTAPYYYDAWRLVRYTERIGLGTMATSAQWVTYYDPRMLREWGPETSAAVLIHELEHLLRRHAERSGDRNHGKFNIAADCEINQHVPNLPDGVYYPSTIGAPDGLTAEQYYVLMPDRNEPEPEPGEPGEGGKPGDGSGAGEPRDGEPQCGSAAGGPPRDYEDPDTRSDYQKKQDERQREDARKGAARRAMGSAPSDEIRQWAEAELGIDREGWYRAIASVVGQQVANMSGYDHWSWPGRRDMTDVGGAVLPRFIANRPECAVVIDTSGSITESDLDMAVAATHFLTQGADVTVYGCNTSTTRYGRQVPENLRGGGGTDMRVGIADAIADGARLVVVITDCATPWPDEADMQGVPLVIGVSASSYWTTGCPQWATVLPIVAEAE